MDKQLRKMSDALDTMSLHSFDRKLWAAAESGGQTAGVVRDEEQAAIEAFNEKDEKIRADIRRGLEIRLVKKHDKYVIIGKWCVCQFNFFQLLCKGKDQSPSGMLVPDGLQVAQRLGLFCGGQ